VAVSDPKPVESGEFAGWLTWGDDPYEKTNGPFVFRKEPDGTVRCAMRVETRHCNGGGAAHGGLLMTFADFCLFAVAREALGAHGAVTVSCTSQFLGPALPGDLLQATGHVARAGKGLIFVNVLMGVEGRPVLSVSGIIKNLKSARAPAAS
jgi:uncharacterized protein (TIGR00369 family)